MDSSLYPRLKSWLGREKLLRKRIRIADYWLAVAASELVSETWCAKNSPHPQVNIEAIFGEAERVLRAEAATDTINVEDLERLRAMLGARGVKTSLLKDEEDYWSCAIAMWPTAITLDHHERAGGLHDLHRLLLNMSKAQRSKACTGSIPDRWAA